MRNVYFCVLLVAALCSQSAPAYAQKVATTRPPDPTEETCEHELRMKDALRKGAPDPLPAWDYPGAVRRPSCRYRSRPRGAAGKIDIVVIHTCESGYNGCWRYLSLDPANKERTSAHYVISSDGSEVTQLVPEAMRARHIGAPYKQSRNDRMLPARESQPSNDFSVGIEHAGKSGVTRFSPGLLSASARLACDLSRRHRIPVDANHIVGHGKLQPYNRSDPGNTWPWPEYLKRVREYCNLPPGA